jgi:RsiW-degrading membrane proteinase PrsW (M82 family)
VILYFVYWLWYRFDISLDAVIKFFASGFVICTSLSLLYELMVTLVTSLVVFLWAFVSVLYFAAAGEIQVDDNTGQSDTSPSVKMPDSYILSVAILSAFLNAFVVAALVEELSKYLCFWMVEHADLREEKQTQVDAENATALSPQADAQTGRKVSLVARGTAITVAMVTTALGFACAENLLYVFVYTPPGIASEVSTLVARTFFPVHPLAAALQSIGVCRRDLEKDSSMGIGRILLPAWILHGTFDFILMAIGTIAQLKEQNNGADDGTNNENGESGSIEDLKAALPVLAISVVIMISGILYYIKVALAQRKRLEQLDTIHSSGEREIFMLT